MKIEFSKYQGTGNDFILIDGRKFSEGIKGNQPLIARLCDRKFGIGADGLIIIEEDEHSDFRMVYYNSDGADSSMCGNGGRCSISFANSNGFSGIETVFNAVDGLHDGKVSDKQNIELGMSDVKKVERLADNIFRLNTGSPHYVYFAKESEEIEIIKFGKEIRYSEEYAKEGINVNVVREMDDGIYVETYERGVEDETLSCGTGVTASAIAYSIFRETAESLVSIYTKGGNLKVHFNKEEKMFRNIRLSGPVEMVFKGEMEI